MTLDTITLSEYMNAAAAVGTRDNVELGVEDISALHRPHPLRVLKRHDSNNFLGLWARG